MQGFYNYVEKYFGKKGGRKDGKTERESAVGCLQLSSKELKAKGRQQGAGSLELGVRQDD